MKRRWAAFVAAVVVLGAGVVTAATATSKAGHGKRALFKAGAAVVSFTPPLAGKLKSDSGDELLHGEFWYTVHRIPK